MLRADRNFAEASGPLSLLPTPTTQGLTVVFSAQGLPSLVFGQRSAPALHDLTSAPLTDPVLQALLQGSSKSRVTLFDRRLGAEFTSSQRDLCNPRVQGSAWLQLEGGETHFPDESRKSWELLCLCEKRRGWERWDLCPKALRPVLDWCSLNTQMTLT